MDDLWWYRRLAGALAAGAHRRPPGRRARSVAFVSPARFADDSIVGGGERTAWDLAAAMARLVPTRMVSFGPERLSTTRGPLRIEIHRPRRYIRDADFDPLSFGFLRDLAGVDVVHCNHYRLAAPQLAILAAAALGKRVFVTDRGAVGHHVDPEVDVAACVTEFLPISRFSRSLLPAEGRMHVIPDGVSDAFMAPDGERPCSGRVLYVGRIMRHKGIDVLIDAVGEGTGLDVLGRIYDPEYHALLQERAQGKDVRFVHDASDEVVAEHYRRALVTVLPSVHDDVFGGHWDRPELLGGVLQESLATGTPVICTAVGGMPEIVRDGENGFVVAPNDPAALADRIGRLAADPALRLRLGENGRAGVRSWDMAAREILARYRS
jgi:glycosyltransferase involved in cell wall biosynthesis